MRGQSQAKSKVVWIDNGASSKGLVDALGGQFIDLNLESGLVLNAFQLNANEKRVSPTKKKLLLGVIESICKEDDSKGLPKREKALLEQAIATTYENCKETSPTMSDLRRTLENHRLPEMRKYADILYSWTGSTAYGRLLDGETNIELSKPLVSIEVKGLDVYPDLQRVLLLILTEYIMNEASQNPSQRYLLIVDEIWKVLQSDSASQFIIECYRTMRKFYGGIWGISQSIKDFMFDPEIAAAIMQNTPNRIILKQRGVDWEEFQNILSLNEAETEAVKSLRSEKGKFSEHLFIQDENKAILKIEPDPLSYWICTTDPKDKATINEFKDKYPELSYLEVLEKIIEHQSIKEGAN
jgi:conjugal transfer ATP-binding protein TraC